MHIYSIRNHPQTNGKAEHLNRTAKEKLLLIAHASPEVFRRWYNYEYYHEGIGNLHPADLYYGQAEGILKQSQLFKEQTKKARKKANLKTTQKPR